VKAILTYHSVDRSGSVISIEPSAFRRHVAWLASGAVRVLPLAALAADEAAEDAVAVTFDDAFASFSTEAWPLLEAHGLPATLFVPAAHVGLQNGWEAAGGGLPILPLLDWAALGRLAERGVELGSHSLTHPDLRRVSDAQLEAEVATSAQRIRQESGREATSFSYPYGGVDRRVAEKVQGRYARAVTTEFRALQAGEDPVLLPRLDAYYFREAGRLERWGTAGFRRFIALRRRLRLARRFFTRG
jgi:peptidoglycan/xylan/chitin deacetylase (PgdA/CDA1 family)